MPEGCYRTAQDSASMAEQAGVRRLPVCPVTSCTESASLPAGMIAPGREMCMGSGPAGNVYLRAVVL
jgi:hypothetical protein